MAEAARKPGTGDGATPLIFRRAGRAGIVAAGLDRGDQPFEQALF